MSPTCLLHACFNLLLTLPLAAAQQPAPASDAREEMLDWHDDYASALEEARRTGEPIFLEFRCAP